MDFGEVAPISFAGFDSMLVENSEETSTVVSMTARISNGILLSLTIAFIKMLKADCLGHSFLYYIGNVRIFRRFITKPQSRINHSTDSRNNFLLFISFIIDSKSYKLKLR